MKTSIILAIFFALVGMACAQYVEIYLRTGGKIDDQYSLFWDEDKFTVGEIARVYCEKRSWLCKDKSKLRVENSLGHKFDMKKTLREAGIRSGEVFYVKSD